MAIRETNNNAGETCPGGGIGIPIAIGSVGLNVLKLA